MQKQHLYITLKSLQGKGLVNATLERPARFSAVPFDKVLDLFVKSKMEEASQIRQGKQEILSDWRSINIPTTDESPKFSVIEGKSFVYPRLKQMVEETQNQLLIALAAEALIRADHGGLLDIASKKSSRTEGRIRFLTEVTKQNLQAAKIILAATEKSKLRFEGRSPAIETTPFTPIIIRDEEEAVFFINSAAFQNDQGSNDLCLWTNCKPLVKSFTTVFEDLWKNSTDLKKKVNEIETGKPSQKTCIISDAKAAANKYNEVIRCATKEIIMMRSSQDLSLLTQNIALMKELISRGVSIKILAPIVAENLESSRQLSELCDIKHISTVYISSTVIDGKHFFQFKSQSLNKEQLEQSTYFEDTFYTNDFEYTKRMETMLNDIWANSQAPSTTTLKAIIHEQPSAGKPRTEDIYADYRKEFNKIVGFQYNRGPQEGKVTEKEIVDKISNATRHPAKDPEKDTIEFYGTSGIAIIYPPKHLNLPVFIIHVNKYNDKSSFGAGSSLMIDVQLNIAGNQSYIPAVLATDNLQGHKFRKAMHKTFQTTEIAKLMKKDELTVQIQGNRLFAGWTVPIPLLPPKYVLPPSCLTIEGYGKLKTYMCELRGPLNRRVSYEFTYLDSFVTFMNPSSNYNGPGTDAMLQKDEITISRPPSAWKEIETS